MRATVFALGMSAAAKSALLTIVPGVQVLSQGGDVSADQVEDTTAETRTR